jgi:hypothetical protein
MLGFEGLSSMGNVLFLGHLNFVSGLPKNSESVMLCAILWRIYDI